MVKNLSEMWKTRLQSLGQEDSLEKGNGYSLQYSSLENSMDRGVWQAAVHGVTKSWTQLSGKHFLSLDISLVSTLLIAL